MEEYLINIEQNGINQNKKICEIIAEEAIKYYKKNEQKFDVKFNINAKKDIFY